MRPASDDLRRSNGKAEDEGWSQLEDNEWPCERELLSNLAIRTTYEPPCISVLITRGGWR